MGEPCARTHLALPATSVIRTVMPPEAEERPVTSVHGAITLTVYISCLRHRNMNTIDMIRVNSIHNHAMIPRPSSLPGRYASGAKRV